MDWAYLQATPDTPFLTCDNPVVFSKGSGIGDTEKGIVLFPLPKNPMLHAMWITRHRSAYVPIRDADVRRLTGTSSGEIIRFYGSREQADERLTIRARDPVLSRGEVVALLDPHPHDRTAASARDAALVALLVAGA